MGRIVLAGVLAVFGAAGSAFAATRTGSLRQIEKEVLDGAGGEAG